MLQAKRANIAGSNLAASISLFLKYQDKYNRFHRLQLLLLNLALTTDQLDRFTQYAKKRHIPPSTLAKAWILERLENEAKEA
jgi:hypothetical protein